MSWDVFVQDFPPVAGSVEEIPADFRPASIGKRAMIVEQIKAVAPSADFSNPSWGTIGGEDWSVEINIGPGDDCEGFAFHVRGGDAAVGVVAAILQHLKLRGVDSQTGEFFVAGAKATDAFSKWRTYRDQIANNQDS